MQNRHGPSLGYLLIGQVSPLGTMKPAKPKSLAPGMHCREGDAKRKDQNQDMRHRKEEMSREQGQRGQRVTTGCSALRAGTDLAFPSRLPPGRA